jgi:hypothetical protein
MGKAKSGTYIISRNITGCILGNRNVLVHQNLFGPLPHKTNDKPLF